MSNVNRRRGFISLAERESDRLARARENRAHVYPIVPILISLLSLGLALSSFCMSEFSAREHARFSAALNFIKLMDIGDDEYHLIDTMQYVVDCTVTRTGPISTRNALRVMGYSNMIPINLGRTFWLDHGRVDWRPKNEGTVSDFWDYEELLVRINSRWAWMYSIADWQDWTAEIDSERESTEAEIAEAESEFSEKLKIDRTDLKRIEIAPTYDCSNVPIISAEAIASLSILGPPRITVPQ
jgi:hypothetical protein